MDILSDLEARGLIHDTTDRDALAAQLDKGPIVLYCGFDPTADSLHVGNLIGLLTLRRFQLAGHRPISLAGGATGMVGDPSGKSAERNLLDDEGLAHNLTGILPQLRQFLDFEGDAQAKLLDNRAWTVGIGVLDFLRDVGKHVTVNQMMAKESVRNRMAEGDGISYTEFSYMLLQGYDYLWLAENEHCELQVGGSDQWGNIVLGVDLIRRKLGRSAHALTWPLLTKPDGSKYGKTAGGETIWLSAEKMSPYRFYQAWIGVDDSEVRKLLLQLTFLSPEEVEEVVTQHESEPHLRLGQRRLASELTAVVHGESAAMTAIEASEVLFELGADLTSVSESALEFVSGEIPSTRRSKLNNGIVDLLVETQLSQSRKEAKRAISEGGVYLNGDRVTDAELSPTSEDLLHGKYLLLRRGKKLWHLLVVG
ncbi:MAG TPA: tyrosine--tRNA ligase [Acidimicrobiia bacterium]|nr:tyrosine--tRNA ligase [Acidimicrobiia bacterium]HIL06587.1 tyrosine--tRNA ligase [Acidimicrobiia bacterium]